MKEKRRWSFWDTFSGAPEDITMPQYSPGHHGQKESQPGTAVLGQWRAGSAGRKQAPWLRTGASGRGVVRPYAQQSAKTIGEVHVNVNTLSILGLWSSFIVADISEHLPPQPSV